MSSDYLNFIDTTMSVAGRSHLPIYSCKYSKRKYTLHQLLTLVLIKEYTGNDYRDAVKLVDLMGEVQSKIGIKHVPHFTTLHKFTNRISSFYFNSLPHQTLKLFHSHGEKIPLVAIDSSVFTGGIVVTIIL